MTYGGGLQFTGVLRSVLPLATAHGITSERRGAALISAVADDTERYPDQRP
jgi:hypothetical protein